MGSACYPLTHRGFLIIYADSRVVTFHFLEEAAAWNFLQKVMRCRDVNLCPPEKCCGGRVLDIIYYISVASPLARL